VSFDVSKCERYGDALDCLVDFIGEVIVVGDCLRGVRNKVCLHICDLLNKTVIVAIAGNWCRLMR